MSFTVKQLEELKAAGKIRGFLEVHRTAQDPKVRKAKYGNKKTIIDGIEFDSGKEAKRYIELRYRVVAGEITDLEMQVEYRLEVNGEKVASYICDFRYKEKGQVVVEDVKSSFTRRLPVYRLKKKLMKSIYGIEIKEV